MDRQLALDLRAGLFRRQDYIEGTCNAAARAALAQWRRWPGGVLALIGAPRAGKSHLAGIWGEQVDAHRLGAAGLPGADPDALAALCARPLVIDPAEPPLDETALFHVLNLAREGAGPVLLVCARAPRLWPVAMPDLASRLAAIPQTCLEPPDQFVLAGALKGACRQRFIAITDQAAAFAASRLGGFAQARDFAARIDAVVGPERRRVGMRVARRVLSTLARRGDVEA
jgi:chromosomal replication initiation ATPase DnaA